MILEVVRHGNRISPYPSCLDPKFPGCLLQACHEEGKRKSFRAYRLGQTKRLFPFPAEYSEQK